MISLTLADDIPDVPDNQNRQSLDFPTYKDIKI